MLSVLVCPALYASLATCGRECLTPLQTETRVSKVQLRVGEEIEGAFLFVGDKSTNNGMDNKACAIVSSAGHTCLAAGARRQLMVAFRMLLLTRHGAHLSTPQSFFRTWTCHLARLWRSHVRRRASM